MMGSSYARRTLRLASVALVLVGSGCASTVTRILDDLGEGGGASASTTTAQGGASHGGASHGGSASSGGAGGSTTTTTTTSTNTVPGTCATASDCAALSDGCNQGACVNGACVKEPANEFGACDDGLFCTENESCTNGVCGGGTPKVCAQGGDSCHVSTCDEATKSCATMPGNDGAACSDGDPCTATAACSNGACVQQSQKDCSFLNGTCATGTCDKVKGCVVVPNADGTSCDDGLFCTVNDVCKGGQCAGVPNTCVPPGVDVCMVGACDEGSKSCVAVPGNDGKACASGDVCKGSETCSGGACTNGKPANDGVACPPADKCQVGTTCSGGACGNPKSIIAQCVNGDGCCPPGCDMQDDDCTPLTKPSYDAAITFKDALPGTTMTITWDGTSFWSCSGGGPSGDRLAQYSANGSLVKVYQPNIDFRAVFTVNGTGSTVWSRGFADNAAVAMSAPGVFGGQKLGLNGGALDAQSAVAWNPAGTELIAMIGDNASSATVTRWSSNGALAGSFTLQGFNQNGENAYPANRGVVAAGKWYLTYSNGTLSAWDGTGKRVSSTKLNGAGTGFDSHFSFSYAQKKVFVVDSAGGLWRGYDVGL